MISLDGRPDLLTIRAKVLNAYMDFKDYDRAFYSALGDVKVLLAEVERLQEEAAAKDGSGPGPGPGPGPNP